MTGWETGWQEVAPGVGDVLARMHSLLERLDREPSPGRHFLATYSRTTAAVGEAIAQAGFEDPVWVDRWDVAFAELYLDAQAAFEAEPARAPRPWRIAFTAGEGTDPVQQVLLGMNAHINYDLPQALLAVISDEEFGQPLVMARRRRDHERIDAVLASRVAAESAELDDARVAMARRRSLLDRTLEPANRLASRRFLREARQKVWHNTAELQAARLAGADVYRTRLAELEVLTAARVADLLTPGHVLLKLGVAGFGVVLPPA